MRYLFAFLACVVLIGCGCAPTPKWQTDLKILELLPAIQPEGKAIQERIEKLYEAVRDRDWTTVYAMRSLDFRRTVSLEMFTSSTRSLEYTFTGYDILRHDDYHNPGEPEKKRFIVRFHVNGRERYNVVEWIREDGIWNAENLGFETAGFPFEMAFGVVSK